MRATCGSVALVGAVVFGVACTRATASADAPVTPAANASASSSPSAARPAPTLEDAGPRFAAWTDDVATAEIVKSCHVKAPRTRPLQRRELDPLVCELPWRQSCFYNACYERTEQCRKKCGGTCRACDEACGDACDSCKAACKDETCRISCAKKTGVCKQACLTEIDHCGSAECSTSAMACWAEEKRKWKSHGCSCNTIRPCTQRCTDKAGTCAGDEPCFGRCKLDCSAKFPGCDVEYCISGDESGLEH